MFYLYENTICKEKEAGKFEYFIRAEVVVLACSLRYRMAANNTGPGRSIVFYDSVCSVNAVKDLIISSELIGSLFTQQNSGKCEIFNSFFKGNLFMLNAYRTF